MDIEKNIIEIVNNVLQIIQNKAYYSTNLEIEDIDLKIIDSLWDFFRLTSKIYKKKYKNHKFELDFDEETILKLQKILDENSIFVSVFSLHILTEKPHIITFNYSDNDNIFILYKNEKNELELPSNFISLTMPNPISNESSENLLNISCYFED